MSWILSYVLAKRKVSWQEVKNKLATEGALNKQYDSDLDGVADKVFGAKRSKNYVYDTNIPDTTGLFDEDLGTYSGTTTPDAHWYVIFDLGGPAWVDFYWKIYVLEEAFSGVFPQSTAYTHLVLETSDDLINWTTIKSYTGNAYYGQATAINVDESFKCFSKKYLRVRNYHTVPGGGRIDSWNAFDIRYYSIEILFAR